MCSRLKLPPNKDFGFYQRRKHDEWSEVEPPQLEAPVADSHAHIQSLPDSAWELARCAANGVDYLCMFVDPSEDGARPFDELDGWMQQAAEYLAVHAVSTARAATDVRIAVGVHPHNAKLYDDAVESELLARLDNPRVAALGEIGLDYYYDLSPRDVQKQVFCRQIALAKERQLPVALHLRGGKDAQLDNAHADAFSILQEVGFPEAGTLLHCCALPPDELRPWIEAGCYIAYGGTITFKSADDTRAGARLVPTDRLLFETDSPYMTPEPMRGTACTPAHVVFTAVAMADVRGAEPGEGRRAFLQQVHANTLEFYRRPC